MRQLASTTSTGARRAGVQRAMARAAALACVLLAGMLAGGERADATTSYFSTLSNQMTAGRAGALVAALPSGKILIAGGTSKLAGGPLASSEQFDPVSAQFTAGASLSVPRSGAVATSVSNGEVLIAGGTSDGTTALSSAELFNPATGHSTMLSARMSAARIGALIAPLPDGSILIAGGSDGASALDSAELYEPASGSFTALSARLTKPRVNAIAAPLPDGRVLIAGGSDGATPLQSAELFNPATAAFTATSHLMNVARSGAVAAPLPDGRILIAGGTSDGSAALESSELFDASSGAFSTQSPALTSARIGAVAIRLPEGEVLVAGGEGSPANLDTAEAFISAPEISASGGAFGSTYVEQTSPTLALELTNVGAQQLQIYSTELGGADPEDFEISSDECLDVLWLAFGQTCTVGVRFSPEAAGEATATVAIVGNEAKPAFLPLSGTGVEALENGQQGEPGQDGLEGREGEEGASGEEGAEGRSGGVELVNCETVTVKVHQEGKTESVPERKCTTSELSSPAKFTAAAPRTSTTLLLCKRASKTGAQRCSQHALKLTLPSSAANVTAVLERHGKLRASGTGKRVKGTVRLRLVEPEQLAAGKYELIVSYHMAGMPRQRASATLTLP